MSEKEGSARDGIWDLGRKGMGWEILNDRL